MKKKIITASAFIILYTFLLTITFGNHTISLPIMLLSVTLISYLFFNKNPFTIKNYLLLNLPFASLALISLLSGGHVYTILKYLLLVPICSYLGNYFYRLSDEKSIKKNKLFN
jgi:hypothetical protein